MAKSTKRECRKLTLKQLKPDNHLWKNEKFSLLRIYYVFLNIVTETHSFHSPAAFCSEVMGRSGATVYHLPALRLAILMKHFPIWIAKPSSGWKQAVFKTPLWHTGPFRASLVISGHSGIASGPINGWRTRLVMQPTAAWCQGANAGLGSWMALRSLWCQTGWVIRHI